MKYLILSLLLFISIGCKNKVSDSNISELNQDILLQQQLLKGWNTWNNPNILSRVHMPDGLSIQLSFRSKIGGPYWLTDSYIASTKTSFPETITPLKHAVDGRYISLRLNGTDWLDFFIRQQKELTLKIATPSTPGVDFYPILQSLSQLTIIK